ncbi:MAG: c-type cytochrome [Lewinellaceae bacterium]|nr:c-type cytochrome [Saprospiraceae bacterium]MCB9340524.1 c-type cytochrome [Lewinellaceae bacterium]
MLKQLLLCFAPNRFSRISGQVVQMLFALSHWLLANSKQPTAKSNFSNAKNLLAQGIITSVYLILCSCRKDIVEPIIPLSEFQLEKGFQISCVASEPFLDTPVAIDFDTKGRIWAVEMPAYMPNVDGIGEDDPIGKIVILEDRDGDGIMDSRKIFLDNLLMVRALALVYGGLLYAEPPNLWFVEITNDQPGSRTLVDSTYAPGFNPEYQANGLLYNLDNWIYSAASDKRYQLQNGQWKVEKTFYRGQWGIAHDASGKLVFNNNALQLLGDYFLPGLMENNPANLPSQSLAQVLTSDQRVYPVHETLVNRGYQPGVLDSLGKLKEFTAACGPAIYLGGQFPAEFAGNAFVCAPEANLVKRNLMAEDKQGRVVASQAYPDKEFLASTDGAFRPVNLKTGPDGCLYIVDMRRGIIQHKAYMSLYLKNVVKDKGLDTVMSKGRIYRVCYEKNKVEKIPDISQYDETGLVNMLSHKNSWFRIKAQQLLIERNKLKDYGRLKEIILSPSNNYSAFHALWALKSLKKLDDEIIIGALNAKDIELVEHTLTILPQYNTANEHKFTNLFYDLANRKNRQLDMYMLAVLGRISFMEEGDRFLLMGSLLVQYPNDSMACEAALAGLAGKEINFQRFLDNVFKEQLAKDKLLHRMLEKAINQTAKPIPASPRLFEHNDMRTVGLHLYGQYCAACHRPGGEGTPNLAPPLVGSKVVNGPKDQLAAVIWNGKSAPVQVGGNLVSFKEPMQAFRDNPEWDEKMLEAVVAYIKNAFVEPE